MAYGVQAPNGKVFTFHGDTIDLSDFADFGSAEAQSEDFRTVSTWTVDDGVGVAFGRGTSQNPDRAEAYVYFDAKDDGDAAMDGLYRLAVLNSANERVATIYRNRLDVLRNGDPSADSRGDWGVPFPYQAITNGKGEILGGDGYKIAHQIQLDSGTGTFSTANSTAQMEGYRGTVQN
jgi:hypothetical protein